MPRWAKMASPSSNGSHRYLPRRRGSANVRPATCNSKSAGPVRCRRTGLGCSTRTPMILRPVMLLTRPRRTTSTSGSSGTRVGVTGLTGYDWACAAAALEGREGNRSCVLLGFLFVAAGTWAVAVTVDVDHGLECLRVIRSRLNDVVDRYAEANHRGDLLQTGLPIQSRAARRNLRH